MTMMINLAGRPGSYRPPAVGRYRPTGAMRKSVSASMRKLADDLETRHPDLGAHLHVRDAARALERNQPEAANRHLTAAVGNMTPQSLLRHGLLTDEHHDAAKRSMDAVHRHMLLVKDIADIHAENSALPRLGEDHPQETREPDDDGLDEKPTAREPAAKAMNAPGRENIGTIDINVTRPQKATDPRTSGQVAASNSGDLTTAINLSAKTGALAVTPHPLGKPGGPGLWHVKGMELPPYIQNIAHALLRTGRAKDLSQAIAIARGATRKWARGGGNVHPEVRAASAASDADWEAKRARAHAHANVDRALDLAHRYNPSQPRDRHGKWTNAGLPNSAFPTVGAHDPSSMIAVGGGRKHWADEASQPPDRLVRQHFPQVAARERYVTPRRVVQAQMDEVRIGGGEKPLYPELSAVFPWVYAKAGIKPGPLSALGKPKMPSVRKDSFKVTGLDPGNVPYMKAAIHQMMQKQGMGITASNTRSAVELTGTAAGAAKDPRVPAGQPGGGTFGTGNNSSSGGPRTTTQGGKPTAHQQHMAHLAHQQGSAGKKAALLKAAAGYRAQADALIAKRDAMRKALASASGKVSKGQAGSKTSGQSGSTTKSSAPAAKSTAASGTAAAPKAAGKKTAAAAGKASSAQLKSQIAALNVQIVALQNKYRQAMAQAKTA